MTQSKNSSLIQLVEVFPSWPQEDLQAVLNEAGGDVYVAISRISEGHVSQWSDSTKKATITSPTFESRASRTDRNERGNRREYSNYSNKNENKTDNARSNRPVREQRDRTQSSGNRTTTTTPSKTAIAAPKANVIKPTASNIVNSVNENLSWGDSAEIEPERTIASMTTASVADRAITASKTSFAEAAASALAEKPQKKDIPIAPANTSYGERSVEIENEIVETQISEPAVVEPVEVVETVIPEPELVPNNEPKIIESIVVESDIVEEEEIVFMPARATPSLTMEQPAVVLPVRTNLRTNLTVRFGYDASEDLSASASSSVEKISVEETQPTKTPITVSALESTFAMLSTSPVSTAKSPEPILSPPVPEVSAWESSRNSGFGSGASASNSTAGYGNFSRGRHHGGWDYEPSNSAPNANPSSTIQGSFGPAPGFSGPASPAAPQRFTSRAAAQYEHSNAYNSTNSPSGSNTNNSRFSPYEETNVAGNNVSQYYTSRTSPQATSGGYPVYRGGNSFNSARYNTPSRPYYQQHPSTAPHNHQQAPASQQQSSSTGHYTPYNPHQNYLNNYHHGYPQYAQHADQYSHQQQHQQQPQQPYYQPYQPPNQYLSNANMHHHSHHQNQHHNA